MTRILQIDTPALGDRSYLAHDGEVALVIDPQRDIDRVLWAAGEAGVRITHVFETHIHNDYVTGGLALARATGAAYHVNGADPVSFERVPVSDGDVLPVGENLRVTVMATPGHTFTHLAYLLEERSGAEWVSVGVFTGGSLLHGAVGRPDLLGAAHTDALVRHQHASAHRLSRLPEQTRVLPTHGFGSFCAATQSTADASTIAVERETNSALRLGLEEFVEQLLAGLDAWPAYYARMAPANLAGPGPSILDAPQHATAAEVRASIAAGEWVVDLRNRVAFGAGHVVGSVNFGVDGDYATHLGWVVPGDARITLLSDSPQDIIEARRGLSRIGIDPAAQATGTLADWTGGEPAGSLRRARFADLVDVRHHREIILLDVRRDLEHAKASLPGAVHIPLHELLDRIHELPEGEIWLHCASGYRASVAASILSARGRRVVLIDDNFERALRDGVITAAIPAPVSR